MRIRIFCVGIGLLVFGHSILSNPNYSEFGVAISSIAIVLGTTFISIGGPYG